MILEEQIYATYQYFYIKYVKNDSYLFVPSESDKKSVKKFVDFLELEFGNGSINSNTLFNFFALQFYHYSQPFSIKSKRFLKIMHVLGEKSIERWQSKNSFIEKEVKKYCSDNEILLSELNEIINHRHSISFNRLEEIERKRFFNTDFGISHCLSVTSGYNRKSEFCDKCKFMVECKKSL
jgi:hypothetical protein